MKPCNTATCVQRWLARDPLSPGPRRVAAWARCVLLRSRLLRHLVRDPQMWRLQGRNILRGLARLGVLGLGLAPPVLAFWEPGVWPAVVGGGCLGLLLLDRLLGQRLSGFTNVFVDTAERLAWVVVAMEPPEEPLAARSPRAPSRTPRTHHEGRRLWPETLASLPRCWLP